ncbi:ABC transporter ATP-binding protein [Palleronia pelagia]|uniref:Amino acid/amide ABC transporter ATP-binding protein 2, HAAT family n=1 Tax=Palleronia pelagia TaxID=387096 RepID=A0A1H8MIT5_9RHOB|nr:ATP-binding cassette domain-containing protein [Palleronia pelagia]SEO17352.1 amino acid/amide ABC transporter ATP-binding protein 2, HAAT family [Palleronia pelagia]
MLEFRNADAFIGKVPILRGLTLRIDASETIALIGRNGAGKTTTLRSVMGFTDVRGQILVDGNDITKVEPSRRPALGIGYAPEDRRLFSGFTVEENVLLPGEVAGLSSADRSARLDKVYQVLPELKEMADRPAGAVSGGQRKMVALGRGLMLGTRLLMLDEPFQGLAPALAHRYADALKRLRDIDRDVTVLVTESNPTLLKSFAERTLVIERGEITEPNRVAV